MKAICDSFGLIVQGFGNATFNLVGFGEWRIFGHPKKAFLIGDLQLITWESYEKWAQPKFLFL